MTPGTCNSSKVKYARGIDDVKEGMAVVYKEEVTGKENEPFVNEEDLEDGAVEVQGTAKGKHTCYLHEHKEYEEYGTENKGYKSNEARNTTNYS